VQVVGPVLTKTAIDHYLDKPDHPASSPLDHWLAADPWTGMAQISALYLAAIVIGFLCEFAETYLMQRTGQMAMFDLRRELMEHLQRLDVAYYDRHPVGRLITRVTTDVDPLNELWASGLVTILGDLLALGFVFLVMLRLSPGLTMMLFAVMPFVILVTARFRSYVQQSYRQVRVAIARINSYLQEHVSGIAVVQLFNRKSAAVASSSASHGGVDRRPSRPTAGFIRWSNSWVCWGWRCSSAMRAFASAVERSPSVSWWRFSIWNARVSSHSGPE